MRNLILFFSVLIFVSCSYVGYENSTEGDFHLKITRVDVQDSLVFNVKYAIGSDELEMNGFYFYVYQTTNSERLITKQIIGSRKGSASIVVYYQNVSFSEESTDEFFKVQLCRLDQDRKKKVLVEDEYCLEDVSASVD